MLTENDVVDAVSKHLQNEGYSIEQTCTTHEQGVDIVAVKGKEQLYVEAKGATSSKEESSRYGKEFNLSQVKTYIGMAILAAMCYPEEASFFIALPEKNRKVSVTVPVSRPSSAARAFLS